MTSKHGNRGKVATVAAGLRMMYAIKPVTSGWYTVQYRVAAADSKGRLELRSDDTSLNGTIVHIPNTGSLQSWATVSSRVYLNAGSQNLEVATTGTFNLDWISFAREVGTPDFGPNVLVFDPSTSPANVQSNLTSIFTQQESNHFGEKRFAVLFKPGSYSANIRVGFFTQVSGLGQSPDAVTINGGVNVDAAWCCEGRPNNATTNFWRSVENMAINPSASGGTMKWAVSQASPLRRVDVKGNLVLDDQGGWASGGYLGDSHVDGRVNSGTQQQWLSRNSGWGSWIGASWNNVFVGANNPPAGTWPSPSNTVIDHTPVVQEKPFLTIDAGGKYAVFVPPLTTHTQGPTWLNKKAPGQAIPIASFYIAKANDTAATLNAALSKGKHLLFTPGVYHLNDTIRVDKPNTVVLGLGLATLVADNGVIPMMVADVDGVRLGGFMFDAGATTSPVLLQLGASASAVSHAANPSSLHDIYFSIGGARVGNATTTLLINSNDVIGDNLWLWRADHDNGNRSAGWSANKTVNGLVVNGANVTMYGLAVEHYHQYQTVWNGNGGRVYFYQSEAPYDMPNQASWMNAGTNGYASYKVSDGVRSHQAWGLGVYCYFKDDPSVRLSNGIEIPVSGHDGLIMRNMTSVSLGGVGEITHVMNGNGATANAAAFVARLER